ncbi:flagellar protein FlaG, partial [Fibrobacterota bacterium]
MDEPIKISGLGYLGQRVARTDQNKKRKKREQKKRDDARHHFQSLANAAERAHKILEQMKSPYRFCVYEEDNKVFIDVVALDSDGKIKEIKKKNITY